jgi:hypothetical protein
MQTRLLANGQRVWAEEALTSDDIECYQPDVVVDSVVVNLSLPYDQKGELLYLIGTPLPQTLRAWYKRRWAIEVFFQALKQRGFNLTENYLLSSL